VHRILNPRQFRPGALVLATPDQLNAEQEALARGELPTQILPVELWAKGYHEIDVFNWQEAVSGMISSSDLEVQLATAEGRIRSAIERGIIVPDHTLTLGERTYYYLRDDRAEEVRQQLGLPRVDDASIRDLFLEFVTRMDMASSYKPVMLLSLLDRLDEQGKGRHDEVVRGFHSFYHQREQDGFIVERPIAKMARASALSEEEVRGVMLSMPFEKFERRRYLHYDRGDLAFIRFAPPLWRQLKPEDFVLIRKACEEAITTYYEQLASK
jgi:hypothetical protein